MYSFVFNCVAAVLALKSPGASVCSSTGGWTMGPQRNVMGNRLAVLRRWCTTKYALRSRIRSPPGQREYLRTPTLVLGRHRVALQHQTSWGDALPHQTSQPDL